MKFIRSLVLLFLVASVLVVNAQISARMFRYPDVSKTHVAFSYGGDIWIVPIEGGSATRLSSPVGPEIFPKFSPDGSLIAFSGNYDGNVDIYVIPTLGGIPQRVTHHGMDDRIQDWYPDGSQLLFTSSMNSGKQRFSQFYKLDKDGGLPAKLPMAYGEFGSLNANATKIAFTDKSRIFRNWKRYKGGMAADIFIFDLQTLESENITNNDGNDEMPMWYNDRIYYLSDKGSEKRYNIWYYDTADKENIQVTHFADFDIHMPSIGPGNMVFEAGGKMYIMDLVEHKTKEIKIEVTSDLVSIKPHKVSAKEYVENAFLAPDGNRAVIEARGELFSVPAEKGIVQNLTRTSGTAERYPAWSPNGQFVAYWSDQSGEYELTIRDLKNGNKEKQITKLGPGFRYHLFWSPDSKKIAFVDQTMSIMLADISTGAAVQMDKDISLFEGGLQGFNANWSSDSRWVCYDKTLDNGNSAIFIYDTKDKVTRQVTSGFYSDHAGAFDPDGKYLYIGTNRNFNPVYSDYDNSWVYPNATSLAAIALRSDVPSPLAPINDTVAIQLDDETSATKEKEEKEKEEKEDDRSEKKEVKIDFDGFERRLIVLPPKPGNFGRVAAVSGKVIYQRFPNSGSESEEASIKMFVLDDQEEKTIISGVNAFQVSADGKKMLVAKNDGSMAVIDVAADQKMEKTLALNEMELTVDPREEWKQIFNDAWRFERDFFYDKGMHGVDWTGLRDQYGALLEYAMNRDDVNFIIGELIAELNASHTYRGGGDQESPTEKSVGYLGVDWTFDQGHYKVKEIIRGADWDNEVRSPLESPGVNVKEGDYILAVNGVLLTEYSDPWGAFEGLADKTVELTINDKPMLDGSRVVIVKTLNDETRLRNLAWIEQNRKEVDKASGGKIGYIYVPSTGRDGQEELVRQFYAQWNKEGLVIDERFNNGGQIPDRFIELLNRKPLAYWSVRDGKDWQWPPVAHFGPMAMLANGWSGSGGDAFPDYFQKAGLGPVIGTRTWGGLIGISGSPSLIDGGSVTVPTFRMYNPDGTWFKEGHGVDPDLEVKEDPTSLAKGIDTQLQAAIDYVMDQIKKRGPIHPQTPGKEKRT